MVGNTQPDQRSVTKLRTMKKMKRTIYTMLLALLIAGNSYGQNIDQKRMDRDLEIAENILQTLTDENHSRNFFSTHSSESSYIPDYGVIFSLPSNPIIIRTSSTRNGEYVISGSTGKNVVISPSNSNTYTTDSDDDCNDCPDKVKTGIVKSHEESLKKSEETFKEQTTAFLVDYADLIGQLKPSEKIMITSKSKNNNIGWIDDGYNKKQSTGMTAEIAKSDLVAYKHGELSREATIKKIKFTTTTKDVKLERDLELFSSIFAKLYDSNLSTSYYTSSHRVNYERLENFGAIYNMRVYSSSQDNGLHSIRTTRERGLTQEERDKKVNAMYPEFEKSVKENILDYGRTIKSLQPNEMLMFKIRLTECNDCEMPRSIEVSVKANILSEYGSGKLSRDKAMTAITVKKTSN